jgi:uncharacterized protein (DUF1501 family)
MQSRRVFLKNGSLALLTLGFAPDFLARAAQAGAPRRRVLIAIFQRGAVDGLNMVVPFGDEAYYRARRSIAIARPGECPDAAIDLDGFYGLHPRLWPLKPLYDTGLLAIVHACGSPDPTRSHLDAQDFLESGTPGVKSTRDGWLNRCLHDYDHQNASPFRAVAVAPQLPRSLQGPRAALAVGTLDRFATEDARATASTQASLAASYAAAAGVVPCHAGREAVDAARQLEALDRTGCAPAHGAEYPRSPLGGALRQIAQLVKADIGVEIAFAESSGWDHHVNEGGANGQLGARLDDLGRSLAALTADLGDRLADVLILTMSEFGRAVNENGNGGTDHGHGTALFVAGGNTRGGRVYGRWPGLEREQRHEGRDLAVTTDFRSVFGEIAVKHLGVTRPDVVFPGFGLPSETLPGFLS